MKTALPLKTLAWSLALVPILLSCKAPRGALADDAGLKDDGGDGSPAPAPHAEQPAVDGRWTPVVALRDTTDTFPGSHESQRPDDGWWVTPIHANLLANGKVLVTGWSREKERFCTDHKGRQNGTSFVLDPSALDVGASTTLEITPLDEKPKKAGDVLYCAGHAPMSDGRVLFMGGARYTNLDDVDYPNPFNQDEFGLNYARSFDPATETFTRIEATNPGGPTVGTDTNPNLSWTWYEKGMMWYPSNTRLPDGRILVNGGFAKWADVLSRDKWDYLNKSITVFDPKALDAGDAPWSELVPHRRASDDVAIDAFDYPRVWVLPQPVTVEGKARQVAIFGGGKTQRVTLLALDGSFDDAAKRLVSRGNAKRPRDAKMSETTSVLTSTGEIMIMGGGGDGKKEGQRIDLYNPATDQWASVDTGITRHKAASVLLPDGKVLIVNGEAMYQPENNVGDRKRPTLFDPKTRSVTNLKAWPGDIDVRGYHNVALLLKDGRVLIGGGRVLFRNAENVEQYRIGCERPELRIYSPPYLFKGDRPKIEGGEEPLAMTVGGGAITVKRTGPKPRQDGGAVLMALGAHTHGFDQNQRYVKLSHTTAANGDVKLTPPPNAQIAPVGQYMLFLISEQGVPSVGRAVQLAKAGQ